MNWEARARELQKQVDDLEFQVECLTSALEAHGNPPFAGLSSSEQNLAQLLRARSPNVVSKPAMIDLLYAFRSDGEMPDPKIIDVFICKVRAKLEPLNIRIETAWARGYFMPSDSAAVWDAASGRPSPSTPTGDQK